MWTKCDAFRGFHLSHTWQKCYNKLALMYTSEKRERNSFFTLSMPIFGQLSSNDLLKISGKKRYNAGNFYSDKTKEKT